MQANSNSREVWAESRPRALLSQLSPDRDPEAFWLTQKWGVCFCPSCSRARWGDGTRPHLPHISILDRPVIGGPGMAVVQHSRVLAAVKSHRG